MPLSALLLAVAVQVAPGGGVGSVEGCITDVKNAPVPGATIAAKGAGVRRATVSDAAGCYALRDLPAAPYRVTALLAGFDNVTRDGVSVPPGTAARVDFTMRVSAICECVRVSADLADNWDRADAVLHVRLSGFQPGDPAASPARYRHVATVLNALKPPPGGHPRAPVVVLQTQTSGSPEPYDVGQELVTFLIMSEPNAYAIMNDDPGLTTAAGKGHPRMIFFVRDGRVQQAPAGFAGHVGIGVGRFLEQLRKLSGRGSAAK